MAATGRPETPEQVREQIAAEREQLVAAVEEMREAAAPANLLGPKLPLFAVGALAAGFVLGGGIGATVRLVFRR